MPILQQVYETITISPEVESKVGESLPDWIIVGEVADQRIFSILELELDRGESSAIGLAIEKENSLLIIEALENVGFRISATLKEKILSRVGEDEYSDAPTNIPSDRDTRRRYRDSPP